MEFTKKYIRETDIDIILLKFQSVIDSLYTRYEFLEIPKEEYLKLIRKIILESKTDYSGRVDYVEYMYEKIETALSAIIKERKSEVGADNFLFEKYVSYTALNVNDYLSAKLYLEKLCVFCEKYNISPNFDTILKLLSSNQVFSKIVGKIVDKHLKQIENVPLDKIFNNEILCNIVEAFCMLMNIETFNISEVIYADTDKINTGDSEYMYLQEISMYPRLSLEEERILATKAANGDNNAKSKLIECNLRLVVSVAKNYLNRGCQLIDLVQEGNIGLMKAADRYDINREVKFATYATYWIRQAIIKYINDKSRNIRIPIDLQNKINKYNKAIISLESKLHRSPSLEEIADELNTTVETILYLKSIPINTISINLPLNDNDDTELVEFIPSSDEKPEDEIINNNIREQLKNLIGTIGLSSREIEVLSLRYGLDGGEPLTLEKIGKIYNVTRERIRQIEASALKKIRKSNRISDFSIYMQNPDKSLENIKIFRRNYKSDPDTKKNFLNLQEIKEPKKSDTRKKIKTIYELLGYPKEDVDKMIEKLPDDDKKLLRLRYGTDLNNPSTSSEWDNRSAYLFYNFLLPKMRKILQGNKVGNNNASKQLELDIFGNSQRLFGSNNNPCVGVSTSTRLLMEDYIKLQDIIKSEKFSDLLTFLKPKEALIVCLRLGFIDGKCFSTVSIAQLLNINEDEINKLAQKALEKYKIHVTSTSKKSKRKSNEENKIEPTLVMKPLDTSLQ